MARIANGSIRVEVDIQEAETAIGSGDSTARMLHTLAFAKTVENGTADGQINRVYSTTAAFTTGGTDVDLSGALASPVGVSNTVVLVDLVGVYIENTSAAGNLLVGGDAASVPLFSAASGVIVVGPGGVFFWYAPAGIAVTATTADILQIAASTGTVNGKVCLFGRNA